MVVLGAQLFLNIKRNLASFLSPICVETESRRSGASPCSAPCSRCNCVIYESTGTSLEHHPEGFYTKTDERGFFFYAGRHGDHQLCRCCIVKSQRVVWLKSDGSVLTVLPHIPHHTTLTPWDKTVWVWIMSEWVCVFKYKLMKGFSAKMQDLNHIS